ETVGRGVRLLPEALARLSRYAAEQDVDWVAARVAYRKPAGRLTGLFVDSGPWNGAAPATPALLHRTERLRAGAADGGSGAVYADYPVLVLKPDPAAADPTVSGAVPLEVTEPAVIWDGPRLRL